MLLEEHGVHEQGAADREVSAALHSVPLADVAEPVLELAEAGDAVRQAEGLPGKPDGQCRVGLEEADASDGVGG